MLTLSDSFDDESEAEESEEDAIQFLEPGEDAAVTPQATEETLNLVAFPVESSVIAPGINAIGFVRDHRNHFQREDKLTGFIAFVSTINDHGHFGERPQISKQFAAFGRIMRITRREREGYSGPTIRGNYMNLCGPSVARFADGLGSVFFNAPVPSG